MNKKELSDFDDLRYENELNISRLKQEKTTNLMWLIFVVVLIIVILILSYTLNYRIEKLQDQYVNESTFYDRLDEINNNCGSLFIVKNPYWHKKGYYVFAERCRYDKYCKYDYIKISECYD